jgi:L-lysine exporter family protein LysE/ArgO
MQYFSGVIALISGFLASLSLIIAIGAQNAYVIKQGLLRSHVALVVLFCSVADAFFIVLGVGGLGTFVQSQPRALEYIRWFGVAYLTWFGIKSVRAAFSTQSLTVATSENQTAGKVLISLITFTFLNPHVYLDTVILLGSIANQFSTHRWLFALGASTASVLWFTTIGFGARAASKYMTRPIFWKILDSVIAAIMFSIAITLAFYKFS